MFAKRTTVTPRATAYTGETGKIYRVSWAYSRAMFYTIVPMLAALALFLILVALIGLRRGGMISVAALAASCVASGVGFLMWRHARHQADETFLVLSSAGIAYYGADIVIKTTWANTKAIAGGSLTPYLLLYQPAATYVGWSKLRDPFADRQIPLTLFDYSPRSELARDLRQYAPHLFV
jgi:hypothetical protein